MLSTIQNLVVPRMRATASAVNLFVVNLVGLGVGPLLMGFLNDQLGRRLRAGGDPLVDALRRDRGRRFASFLFYLAGKNLREDLDAALRGTDQES